jgi:hypothetical protein
MTLFLLSFVSLFSYFNFLSYFYVIILMFLPFALILSFRYLLCTCRLPTHKATLCFTLAAHEAETLLSPWLKNPGSKTKQEKIASVIH